MNEATLFGWARRIERSATGAVVRFELQQTRNLNHCIPVEVAREATAPDWLEDGLPVRVDGTALGGAAIPGDIYPPSLTFSATEFGRVTQFASMPPARIFGIEPPPEAATDGFVPPPEQFGDEDLAAFNRIVVCGFLDTARLTDGVNDYLRRDAMEVLVRTAPPPAQPVQVRLYGRHAQTYSRLARDGLPLKVSGALRIRTKPDGAGGLRRMLYIHCAHLRVPLMDELPYAPPWLAGTADAVAAE